MTDQVIIQGETRKGSSTQGPVVYADGLARNVRLASTGEQIIATLFGAKEWTAADEGSFYTAVNPTAGTGIVDTAALTGFVTTTPTMVVVNNNAVGGKSIYLNHLRLNVTAAGSSGTNWAWAMYVDTGNRYSSGGSQITPVNVNLNYASATGALVYFGAITATAANAQRKIAASPGRTVIKVAGDEYVFRFGETSPMVPGMVMEGTAQLTRPFNCPPAVIPPQCSFCFYEWAGSQSGAAGFEFFLSYVER